MKKMIIAGLAGGLILFIWQFLSWSALGLHYNQMAYTADQDQIISCLSDLNLEDGDYFIPQAPPGTSSEEMQAMQEEVIGKPWAKLTYRQSLEMNMGTNFIRGFVVSLLASMLLFWILMNFEFVTMKSAVLSAISVGFIGYLVNPYLNSIWFETNSLPDLIDAIVPWGLYGLFLGWYINRSRPVETT